MPDYRESSGALNYPSVSQYMRLAPVADIDPLLEVRQSCVDLCTRCHNRTLQAAMVHCVPPRAHGLEDSLCTLLLNCSDISQMAANFLLNDSPYRAAVLRLCAEICEACAWACAGIEDMEECAAACRACAERCRTCAQGMAG